jgi:hypothetical protein
MLLPTLIAIPIQELESAASLDPDATDGSHKILTYAYEKIESFDYLSV